MAIEHEVNTLLAEAEKLLREKVEDPEALAASLEVLDRVRQLPAEALYALRMRAPSLAATVLWLATDLTKGQAAYLFPGASQAVMASKASVLKKLLGIEKETHRRGSQLIMSGDGVVWPIPQILVEQWGLTSGWRVEWKVIDIEKREIKLRLKPPSKLRRSLQC